MEENNNGLLSNLLGDVNANVTVALDTGTIIKTGVAIFSSLLLALLIYGLVQNNN